MSRKSRGGNNKDKSGGLPPSFPQESNREHRAFLIRSLERNDVDLTALVELNQSLRKAKEYILSTCGELVLLDLGQGRLTVINDELHGSKKEAISTDDGGDDDPSSSYSLTPKQKEICIDFLLRMKLRRKLLNRLSRRLNRVAHAMDGEDVAPPAPPKYGDLRLHIDPAAVQAYVDRWDKQDNAKKLLLEEKERRRIQEVKLRQEQEEILKQAEEEERRKIQEENLAKQQQAQQENETVEAKAEDKEIGDDNAEVKDEISDKIQDEKPNMVSPDKVASLAKSNKLSMLSSPPTEEPVSSVLSNDLRAVLIEFDSCYERQWDPTKPSSGNKVQYTILDTPMEEDYNVIKYGAGIGAVNSSMSAREREAEYKRWQTALLNRIPDQPTFEELGLKDRVFCLEGRRKRALEDVEDSPSKKTKSVDDTEKDESDGENKNEEDPVKKKLEDELNKVDTKQDDNETADVQNEKPENVKSNEDNVETIKEEEDSKPKEKQGDEDTAMKDNDVDDGVSQANGQADKGADKTVNVQPEANNDVEMEIVSQPETSPAVEETKENAMDDDAKDAATNGNNDRSDENKDSDANEAHSSAADKKADSAEVEDDENNTDGKTEKDLKVEVNGGSSSGDQPKATEASSVKNATEGEGNNPITDPSKKLDNGSGNERAATEEITIEKNDALVGEEANKVGESDKKGEDNEPKTESSNTKEESSMGDAEKVTTSDGVDDNANTEMSTDQKTDSAANKDDAVNSTTKAEAIKELTGEKPVEMVVDSEEPQEEKSSNDDVGTIELQVEETRQAVAGEDENQVEKPTNDDMAEDDNRKDKEGDEGGDKSEKENDQDEIDKTEVKSQDTATDDDSDMFAADSEPELKDPNNNTGDDKSSSLGDGGESGNKDNEAPATSSEEIDLVKQPDSNPEQSKIKIEPRKEFLNNATGEKDGSDEKASDVASGDEAAKEAEDIPKIKIQPRKEFLKDKEGANKENDKQKVEEKKEEPKRKKPISVAPVPSFHQQDLKRIKLIHGDLLATSIHEQARRRLSDVTLEYNKAFRVSNETYERRQAIQQQLTNLRYEHRTTLSKMKNDYTLQVAVAKKRWEKKKREHESKQALRAMPSKWGQQPIGTQTTQRYVAFGGLPMVVGTCIADIVDVACLKREKKLPKSKFEDFVPPAGPDMNKVVNAQTGETYKQQAQRRESEFQREVNSLNVRLQNSEEERKRAWKKMLKTKAEFDVPHMHQGNGSRRGQIKVNLNNYHLVPLPALRNSAQQMVPREVTTARASLASYTPPRSNPGESQSKYSAARVRERISADGTVAPVTEPKKTKEGLYQRPAGRTRKGMQWNALRGIWEKISNN